MSDWASRIIKALAEGKIDEVGYYHNNELYVYFDAISFNASQEVLQFGYNNNLAFESPLNNPERITAVLSGNNFTFYLGNKCAMQLNVKTTGDRNEDK